MKILVVALLSLSAFSNQASADEITVLCKRGTGNSCAERTYHALKSLGCNPRSQNVSCEDASTSSYVDPDEAHNLKGKDFCTIDSDCAEPTYGNFGQVSCSGASVDLKNADRGITLTTSVGFFNRYVTTLCK